MADELRHIWSINAADHIYAQTQHDSTGYFLTPQHLFAVDLPSGDILWNHRVRTGYSGNFLACSESSVYAITDKHHASLSEYDARTGRELRTVRLIYGSPMLWADGRLFTPWEKGTFACLDIRQGSISWQWKPPTGGLDRYRSPLLLGDVLVLEASSRGGIYGVDANSGKQLWNVPDSSFAGLAEDMIVIEREQYEGRFIKTGELVWTNKDTDGLCWNKESKKPIPYSPRLAKTKPIWTNGNVIVSYQGNLIHGYKAGEEQLLPEDRASRSAIAERLAHNLVWLDQAEMGWLRELGEEAVPFLLDYVVRHQRNDERREGNLRDPRRERHPRVHRAPHPRRPTPSISKRVARRNAASFRTGLRPPISWTVSPLLALGKTNSRLELARTPRNRIIGRHSL